MNTLILLLGACAASAGAEPASVQKVSVEPGRVVLTLSRPAGFRTKMEGSPPALVVVLDDAELSSMAKGVWGAVGLVRAVAAVQATEGGVPRARVTIQLDAGTTYSPVWHGGELDIELHGAAGAKATPASAEPEPVVAAKPAPPRRPAAPAGRAFWVQFGSLRDEEHAVKLQAELEPKLGKLEVRRAEVGGKPVFRVLQGPYAGRPAAAAAAEKAAAQGRQGLVIRE